MRKIEVLFNNGVIETYEFEATTSEMNEVLETIVTSFREGDNAYITLPCENGWGILIRVGDVSRATVI